jgi:hypothetical protein
MATLAMLAMYPLQTLVVFRCPWAMQGVCPFAPPANMWYNGPNGADAALRAVPAMQP